VRILNQQKHIITELEGTSLCFSICELCRRFQEHHYLDVVFGCLMVLFIGLAVLFRFSNCLSAEKYTPEGHMATQTGREGESSSFP
jgi:hypothetical protein